MTAPIHCSHSEVWPIDRLKPNPRNPNKHPEEQLRLLAKVITSTGWRRPIVVSRRSGYIVSGHGRRLAAQMAGLTECPVDLQDYATDADELADLVADNRLSELAEMSMPELKDLLQELDTGAIDMELAGFTDDSLAGLMTQIAPEPCLAERWEVTIECADEAAQVALLDRFTKEGLKCRALTC